MRQPKIEIFEAHGQRSSAYTYEPNPLMRNMIRHRLSPHTFVKNTSRIVFSSFTPSREAFFTIYIKRPCFLNVRLSAPSWKTANQPEKQRHVAGYVCSDSGSRGRGGRCAGGGASQAAQRAVRRQGVARLFVFCVEVWGWVHYGCHRQSNGYRLLLPGGTRDTNSKIGTDVCSRNFSPRKKKCALFRLQYINPCTGAHSTSL